jgi:butyryl-CoA dehydrogenase
LEIIRELGELGVFGGTTLAQWDGSEIDPVTYALLLKEFAAGRWLRQHPGASLCHCS